MDEINIDIETHKILHEQKTSEKKPKSLTEYLEGVTSNNFSSTKDQNFIKEIEKELANKDRPNLPYWLQIPYIENSENIETTENVLHFASPPILKQMPSRENLEKDYSLFWKKLHIFEEDTFNEIPFNEVALIVAGRQLGKSDIHNNIMKRDIELYFLRKRYISTMVIIKLKEASYKHDEYYKSKVSKVSWDDSKKQVEIMFSKEEYK